MALGLSLPVMPVNGRAVLETSDSKQLLKILMIQCGDCENINPFNGDVGLDGGVVFQVNDAALQALVRARIVSVFAVKQKEGRARLVDGYPTFAVDSRTEELLCSVKYLDLETGDTQSFDMPMGTSFGR